MKVTLKQINQIAQELQSGLQVFINRADFEMRSIIDPDNSFGDNEFWDEELEKIENEWTDYVIITKMDSRDEFEIMEAFVDEINDLTLRGDLVKILHRKSPFANFKAEIDLSSYRKKWFEFRQMKYEIYVKELLILDKIEIE